MSNNTEPEQGTEAQVVAGLAMAATEAHLHDLHGRPIVIGRDITGKIQTADLSGLLPRPLRPKGHTTVITAESFVREVERLRGARPITLQANLQQGSIICILDPTTTAQASNEDWTVQLKLRLSREWQVWAAADSKPMKQGEFAEFLEDNMPDMQEPTAAEMMAIVKDLQAKTGVDFRSAVSLENGDRQLQYEEKTEAKGKGGLTIPSEFTIGVRSYEGTDPIVVRCLLRYRISEGKLLLFFKRHRPEAILEDDFAAHVQQVEQALGLQSIRVG